MAHTRKDTYTKPKEWAQHLRPFGKRKQAHKERQYIRKELHEAIKQN